MKPIKFLNVVIVTVMFAACGTQKLKVEPVTIQPMHMTIDVNLRDAPDGHPPAR